MSVAPVTPEPARAPAAPAARPSVAPVSVVILTKDEEHNIAGCIAGLSFTDDIVVVDSYSADRTVEIARSFPNVRVYQRAFDTEYKQRNYALHEIEYRHEWVYICDADERVPAELAAELAERSAEPPGEVTAYRVRYKNMYMGRWIKHASSYPVWIIRLVRPRRVTYEVRETNVHPIVDGTIGELRNHFVHYSFNAGLARWLSKHNYYSTREALEGVRIRTGGRPSWRDLWNKDPMARRRTLKNWSYFLVGRGMWRFLHQYVIKLGFLDGAAGFHYCMMIAMYEYWIELKMRECEADWRGATDRKTREMVGAGGAGGGATPAGGPAVDIMIPTLNEAEHIAETVANARELGNVYVLDSLSTDGTQQLARDAGAVVVERRFTNYSDQKNWGLDNLPLTGDWVFILDADERITPALRSEIRQRLAAEQRVVGFYINRVVIFMGRPIRHGGLYPSWNLRLFRRGAARYEDRTVHEHMVCNGPSDYLRAEMLHIRRETISRYLAKHIRYADLESDEWLKWKRGESRSGAPGSLFKDLLALRQWIRRHIWPRLPGRPLWRFLYMYFLRFGFLDRRPGWHLARLMSCYEYMIGLLYKEKRLRTRELEQAVSGAVNGGPRDASAGRPLVD